MQIPTGILADTWGPRKLLLGGSLVAALGTFLFALSPVILMADMGRMFIGGSVAVAFVALLKLMTHWFGPSRYATLSGLLFLCGVGGAASAGVPLRYLVDRFGWRPLMFVSALLALLLALGFASGAIIIGFAFVKESVPPALAGTVSGVCNMGAMFGPMVLQGKTLPSESLGIKTGLLA
jgi:MFS family permease